MGRRNNKKTKVEKIAYFISIVVITAVLNYFGIFTEDITREKIDVSQSVIENIIIEEEKLNILFFDVGQADSSLVISDGKTMLIDAGNQDDGEYLVNQIKSLNINKIDYVIGTHIHEDHIGGLADIIENFEIGKITMPYNRTSTANYYLDILEALDTKGLEITESSIGDKFEIGKTKCEIMAVDNTEPEDVNDSSIVVQVDYDTQEYLFMADATEKVESTRSWEDIDVLKVGHHGSNTSSSKKFLNQVLPEISIIQVGKDNAYGMPKNEVLERLEKIKTVLYRTDESGTIQLISDGKENEIKLLK